MSIDELRPIWALDREALKQFNDGNQAQAREAWERAIAGITKNGQYPSGQHVHYAYEATYYSNIGASYFRELNVAAAARNWHKALEVRYQGVMYEQERRNEIKSRQDMFAAVATVVATAAAGNQARKDKTLSSAQRQERLNEIHSRGQQMVAKLDFKPAAPVDARLQNAGLFEGHIVRVAATSDLGTFSTVGRIRLPGGHCTGTKVGPRTVLTNAHCVTKNRGAPISPSSIEYVREHIRIDVEYKVVQFYTHQGMNGGWDGREQNDWAILILAAEGKGLPHVSASGIADSTPEDVALGKQPLMQAGFSGDLNDGVFLTLHFDCRGTTSPAGVLHTNCDGAGGSSGSAIFTATRPHRIVALHRGRYVDTSRPHRSIEVDTTQFSAKLKELNAAFQ